MSQIQVVDTNRDVERECDSIAEAEETKADMVSLGADPSHIEIRDGENTPKSEQDSSQDNDVVETRPVEPDIEETEPAPVQSESEGLPEEQPSVEEDPVDWLPGHFIDVIQGVPTVNRKGYAVIASQYGVEVQAEPITLAEETDFEYATFRAIATTEDGKEYSGIGSAHIDRGDDSEILNEMAETRAMKRSTAWATGIGMTAIEEIQSGGDNAT